MGFFARKATATGPADESREEGPLERPWLLLLVAMAALVLAGVVALGIGERGSERRALEAMDPTQRRELYEETRRASETMCEQARSKDALEDRCIELMGLLAAFPECDDACRAFAAAHERGPTR
jgi:hypothetical protein